MHVQLWSVEAAAILEHMRGATFSSEQGYKEAWCMQESASYSKPAAQPAPEQRASAPHEKVAQDAARNPYWEDTEGLIEAALQRRAAERQARSASAPAAPKSARPQPEMQAAQVRL